MKLVHIVEEKHWQDTAKDDLAHMIASKHKFATYKDAEDYWWKRQRAAEQEMALINHKVERLVQQGKLTLWTGPDVDTTKNFVGDFRFRTSVGHVYVPKEQADSPLAKFVRSLHRKYEHLEQIVSWNNTDLLDVGERISRRKSRK